ncbi:hypothetical protein SH2C18_24120 [Clostridium sediminicola]|uniref:YciI family protein n=1 Tax=Clostridium sediminicola TaxID=3114879 RepID=UPI0031F1EDE0
MKKGNILYVRTDYKIDGAKVTKLDFEDHLKYLEDIAKERFFMGGGFTKKLGGMIVFEANNIEEAEKISNGDPLISRKLYRYELVEWEMVILSEDL